MDRRSLLLLTLALMPSWAFAQSPDPEVEPAPVETAPPLIQAPVEAEPAPKQDRPTRVSEPFREPSYHPVVRLPFELVGGAVGGVVGLLPGVLLISLGATDCGEGCGFGGVLGVVGGLMLLTVGGPLGMMGGILGGGSLFEGQGQPVPVVLGMAVGGGAGYLFSKGWGDGDFSATSSWIFTASSALVGGIVAYEISHHLTVETQRARHEAGLRLTPTLSVSQDGAFLGGFAGSF